MFTWIMAANAAAWLMVALTLYSMGRFGFVANLFWGPLLMGAGAFTIALHLADAPQPNLMLAILLGVIAPFGLLARR